MVISMVLLEVEVEVEVVGVVNSTRSCDDGGISGGDGCSGGGNR